MGLGEGGESDLPRGTRPSVLTEHTDGCALSGKGTATAASQGVRGLHPAVTGEEGP